MSAHRRSETGFTLVSVLISVTMLSVGLLALARTQALLTRTQGSTATRSTALAIAQAYVEVLRSRDPGTLASESAQAVDAQGQADTQGQFTRSTLVSTDATNLRRVTVQVSYPGAYVPIELVTLIFRGTP